MSIPNPVVSQSQIPLGSTLVGTIGNTKILETTATPLAANRTVSQAIPFTTQASVRDLPVGGQVYISGAPQNFAISSGSAVRPTLIQAGSQVSAANYQTISRMPSASNISRPSIQVYKATGPPISPLPQSTWRPTQSIVRPVNIIQNQPIIERKIIYENPIPPAPQQPVIITPPPAPTKPLDPVSAGPPIVESRITERFDPVRQQRRTLYESKGYTENKKTGCPWLWALLGLLLLAGLLTGLYFLIRALNSGSKSAQTKPSINYKQNATITNTTNNTQPLSPVVIDVNTNPLPSSNTTTTTTTNSTTTVITTNTTQPIQSNITGVNTTVVTINPISVNPVPITVNGSTAVVPGTVTPIAVQPTATTTSGGGDTVTFTNATTTTTTTTVAPGSVTPSVVAPIATTPVSTTTTTTVTPGSIAPIATTPVSTTSTTTVTPGTIAPIVTVPTSTTGTTTTTSPGTVAPISTLPVSGTTSTTGTTTTTSTTTNTATTNGGSMDVGTRMTSQQITSDPNVALIDRYLRQQDGARLGTNPTINSISQDTLNGTPIYYFNYSNGSGKIYLYGVVVNNGVPQVKTVRIAQQVVTTPRHQLANGEMPTHMLRKFVD